jgi:hypothetical protein
MGVLAIERVEVRPGDIDVVVRVVDPDLTRTSAAPGLAPRALDLLPGLSRHSCENGAAHGILGELADTETPHLFEHVVVEVMSLAGSPRDLRAETEWDFARDGQNVYHVRFAYDDDLVALAALRDAACIVDWLMGQSTDRPDVGLMVDGVLAARSIAAFPADRPRR